MLENPFGLSVAMLRTHLAVKCVIILGLLVCFACGAPIQLDTGFPTSPGLNSQVNDIAEVSDGTVWVGGAFTSFNGSSQYRVAKIGANGAIDTSFAPPSAGSTVNRVVPLPSGKVLVGGSTIGSGETYRRGVARLNADGSVDTAFNAPAIMGGTVYDIEVMDDGKILVAGNFSPGILRLEANGALDTNFTPGTGASTINAIEIMADGKIMVGGSFSSFDGYSRANLCRLGADGSLDTSYGTASSGPSSNVRDIKVLPDGDILVGGDFTSIGGISCNWIVKLDENGLYKPSFLPSITSSVYSILPLADGRIVIGGSFSAINSITQNKVAVLRADGSYDPTFDSSLGPNSTVTAMCLSSTGGIFLGGSFTTISSAPAPYLAKILPPVSTTAPAATEASHRSAEIGTVLQIKGSNFSNLSSIEFSGGIVAAFTFVSETEISVTVPAGALNGPLTLKSPYGQATTSFTFFALPSVPGTLDPDFDVGSGANSSVYAVARDSSGNVVIGGNFSSVNGHRREEVARLLPDGSVDASFIPPASSSSIRVLTMQPDGRILVGGSQVGNSYGMARLNADGSPDGTFDASSAVSSSVYAIAVQADGKVIVGGSFTRRLARLHANGSLDTSFEVGSGMSSDVNAIRIQPDGKILVGGSFSTYNGMTARYVTRLLSDGSIDPSFQIPGTGLSSTVYALGLQGNGQILVGGSFSSINGNNEYSYFARLEAGGAHDLTFHAEPSNYVRSIEVAEDGRIAIGGEFTSIQGVSRDRAALLHADGGIVTAFNTTGGPSSTVYAVLPQADGKVVVGGSFGTIYGRAQKYIARLAGDGGNTRPAISSISPGSGVAGDTVIIHGSNLGSFTSVRFSGGTVATVISSMETQIEVLVPTGAMTGPITVSNPVGEGSSVGIFKYLSDPVPVIASIPASSVAIGSTFTITGENFYDVTRVRIGVVAAEFEVISAVEMRVTVPNGAVSAPLFLTGPGGTAQSATSLSVIKAIPVISSPSVASGAIGQNFRFTLAASNSPTSWTAAPLPAGLQFNPTSGVISGIPTSEGETVILVSATNAGGTANGTLTVTIQAPPAPILTAVSPAYVPVGGNILVSGRYFTQTTSVTVGGVAANFSILSDGRISVEMPAGVPSGVVEITTLQGVITSSTSVSAWDFTAGSQIVSAFGENGSGETVSQPGLDDVIAISAGGHHNLALRADGSIAAWGGDWAGQASIAADLAPAISVSAGGHHSLALLADGTVAAWGRNSEGQCSGAGSLTDIAEVSAGTFHSLALRRNGTVVAWGSDEHGECSVPANLGGVVAIAAGGDFSLALKADGTVIGWGSNSQGQIELPVGATDIIAISAGSTHAIALKADGTVICWGANWIGQCVPPMGLSNVIQVAAGNYHSLALLSDGSSVAWGADWSGQASAIATTDATAVSAGGDHSLVLHSVSPVPKVELPLSASGKPGQAFSLTPVTANGPFLFTASGLPAGLSVDSASGAITGTPLSGGDSVITLTGRNSYGLTRVNVRLFIGPYLVAWGGSIPGPVPSDFSDVVKVSAGRYHCLALHNDGTVSGWGNNSNGQTAVPAGLDDVIDIAVGDLFSMALTSDGSVFAWGRNPETYTNFGSGAVLTGVVSIKANGDVATALMADGSIRNLLNYYGGYAWGSGLIAISDNTQEYFGSFGSVAAINREGYVLNTSSNFISTVSGFEKVAQSGFGDYYYSFSDSPSIWGIHRDGRLFEFLSSRYSSESQQYLRAETTEAVDVVGGAGFALILNADATAFTLEATRDQDNYGSYPYAPDSPADPLIQVGAIAASEYYAIAIKDPVARSRFTSLPVSQGRTGQSFSHQLTISGGKPFFSVSQLPSGLTIDRNTGLISGTPSSPGVFNMVAIASYQTYFITQVVSLEITTGAPPLDLVLTGNTIVEDLPSGATVGSLSTFDPTPSDTFSYSLVAGSGSTDNGKFRITGNQLLSSTVLDFETRPQMSVRIGVTDSGGNTLAKVFNIHVTNVTTDDDDGDGLTEAEERLLGTDPFLRDTDLDGAGDGQEVEAGTNPASATSRPSSYVAAWGSNSSGQCNVPTDLGPVIAVAAGDYHTLALLADGTVTAWGQNSSGQCDVPAGLHSVVSVAAGASHSMALKEDGTVVVWGTSSYGLKILPTGLAGVVEISSKGNIAAALRSDGQVVVWGSTSYGVTTVPDGALGSVQIAVGYNHLLALNQSGATVGWGNDSNGQISGPSGTDDLVRLGAGHYLSLGGTATGEIRAWGSTSYSQLTVPADAASAIRLGGGYYFGLALRADGRLFAWGNNGHQQSTVPPGIGLVQMAEGGDAHSVALVADTPPEHFQTTSMNGVTGIPFNRQLSFSGVADRFTAMALPPGISFDTASATLSGTPLASGTYNVRFTAEKGYGRVTRIVPIHFFLPRTYEDWQIAHFSENAVEEVLPLDDADGDSMENLMEYFLNRNPRSYDSNPPTTSSVHRSLDKDYLALTYERLKSSGDIMDLVEVSSDLVTWNSGSPLTISVSITDLGDTERVIVRDATPMGGDTPRFIRLRVEKLEALGAEGD